MLYIFQKHTNNFVNKTVWISGTVPRMSANLLQSSGHAGAYGDVKLIPNNSTSNAFFRNWWTPVAIGVLPGIYGYLPPLKRVATFSNSFILK